tara:strand:+ start:131 stop:457 length:327 start_codon:yes stop_codon:yes gene_type:complete
LLIEDASKTLIRSSEELDIQKTSFVFGNIFVSFLAIFNEQPLRFPFKNIDMKEGDTPIESAISFFMPRSIINQIANYRVDVNIKFTNSEIYFIAFMKNSDIANYYGNT